MRLLVAGGGPGGAAAALQARELGADVTLLEAEQVGGTSLNRGPAPVRTLARAARLARDWSSWGSASAWRAPGRSPIFEAVLANSRPGGPLRPRQEGHRRPPAPQRDRPRRAPWPRPVHRPAHRARRRRPQLGALTASSSRSAAARPRCRSRAGELALTYEDIWTLKALPAASHGHRRSRHRLPDGLDLRRSRSPVSGSSKPAPARCPALMPAFPPRWARRSRRGASRSSPAPASRRWNAAASRSYIHFTTAAPPSTQRRRPFFAAVGWPASLQGLDLDAATVTSTPRAIPVDDYLRTNVEHIFAVGDVNGRSKLVQSARVEGRIAAWNAIHGPARQAVHDVVPSGSFTDPEYGTVGLTEDQAALAHDIVVGIAWYSDLIRPVADGHSDGFCKLIADRRSHAILGAHVLGEYSAETVQVVATAMRAGMNVEQLAEMQFAYPTFTEAVSMAAQKACRTIGIGQFPPAWSDLGPPG